jgi:uncharacterized membrane protein
VVAVSWLLGHLVPYPVVAATNTQVAARVMPRLVDLVAALATGAVGSVALARPDISDTLPGVAIAISLVPPLAVADLTLQSGAPSQSLGALLLFATNVAAILASGIVVTAFLAEHPCWSAFWDKRDGVWRVSENDPDSGLYAVSCDADTVIRYMAANS